MGYPVNAPIIPKRGARTVDTGGRKRNVTPIVQRFVHGLAICTHTIVVKSRSRVTRIAKHRKYGYLAPFCGGRLWCLNRAIHKEMIQPFVVRRLSLNVFLGFWMLSSRA